MARQLISTLRDKLSNIMSNKKEEQEIVNEEVNNTEELEATDQGSQEATEESTTEEVDLNVQLAEAKDKYLRLFAEFDNYKKRTLKEKLELMKTAAQDTVSSLLPVLDDFDRAKKASEENEGEQFSEGVSLVYQKLKNTLKARGLEEMESTGLPFDPEMHEAVTEIPAPNDEMKGKIIDTIEKGYTLKDKIIRYAKVVVGK